jgi:hypothetical protein
MSCAIGDTEVTRTRIVFAIAIESVKTMLPAIYNREIEPWRETARMTRSIMIER